MYGVPESPREDLETIEPTLKKEKVKEAKPPLSNAIYLPNGTPSKQSLI